MENTFDREKHVCRKNAHLKGVMPSASALSGFTVIGYWPETMQRFAGSFVATDAGAAEEKRLRQYPGVSVCGVVVGTHECVDLFEFVRSADE